MEPVTWTEEIRPLLEQSLRLVDKQPTDWSEVEKLARTALTKIPTPVLPLAVPLGKALGVEESPLDCRDALTDCLDLMAEQRHEEAVARLQDAWQAAEQNEGL
jgi:hypothetical protein